MKKFNFLGLDLNSKLNWKDHVFKVANKITKVTGILNKIKLYVPKNVLLSIYNALILPHLNYCILIWGNACRTFLKRLFKIQKKAVRIIVNANFISHTNPLFKLLNIVKLNDLYNFTQLKFLYKLRNGMLPFYFKDFDVHINSHTHFYNTRNRFMLQSLKINHEFAKKCLRYSINELIKKTDITILQRINTHSFSSFSFYTKSCIISNYPSICTIQSCYSCSRN